MKYVLILLFLISCNSNEEQPKFKVGDCISFSEFEELRELHLRRIIKVGTKTYLYKYKSLLQELEINLMDDFYYKVDSKYCEKAGF